MNELKASARAVQDVLDAAGVDCEVVQLPASTRTAQEAADAIGCTVAQIAKSIVFRGRDSDRPVLVVASGTNRIRERTIARHLGEKIAKADADFVRRSTGFVIGGVPPCGHSQPLTIFIDRDLLDLDEIWAAAGTPNAVFRLTPGDLRNLVDGEVVDVT